MNRVLPTLLKATLLICLFFSFHHQAKATHAQAMDMYYECLGGNQYRFTVLLYRDCSGVTAPTSVVVSITSPTCTDVSITLPQIGSTVEVSPLCPGALPNSTCATTSGTQPGVERYVYQTTYTFTQACSDWTVSYDLCCRNGGITNLQSPGSNSLLITSSLDNTGPCNSSPQYFALPSPYVCAGQNYCFSHGAVDPDGDSLVFSLVAPLNGPNPPGSPIPFTGGLSATNPIATTGGAGALTFDPVTGTMCFTPNGAQQAVVAVRVDEYRNGNLISTSRRELQIIILAACGNTQPDLVPRGYTLLFGGVALDSNSVATCPDDSIYFEITAFDGDGDNITMTTNLSAAIPGANFSASAPSSVVVGAFSWTPTLADTGFHTFSVFIQDDGCPILGGQIFSFDIYVTRETNAGPDVGYCTAGGPVQLNAGGGSVFTWTNLGGGGPTGLSCSNCANPTASPPGTQTYVVTSNLSPSCKNRDTITVNVVPDITITPPPDVTICLNGATVLTGSAGPGGEAPFTIQWTPGGSLFPDTGTTVIASPQLTTTYTMSVTSAAGCTVNGNVEVAVVGVAPQVSASVDNTTSNCVDSLQFGVGVIQSCDTTSLACSGSTSMTELGVFGTQDGAGAPFFSSGAGRTWRKQYIYTAAQLNSLGFTGGKIDSIALNIKTHQLGAGQSTTITNLNIKMGCTGITGFSGPNGSIPFIPNLEQVALIPSITATHNEGWKNIPLNVKSYFWDGSSNLVIEFCNDVLAVSPGFCRVAVTSSAPDSAVLFLNQAAGLVNGCSIVNGNKSTGLPDMRFFHCPAVPSGLSYSWTPTTGLSNANIPGPKGLVQNPTTYIVSVSDGSCVGNDFVTVAANCILPVSGLTFDGRKMNKVVDLSWTTEQELNSDYFLLEKSTNGKKFEFLARVQARGWSDKRSNYGSIDNNPVYGSNFYRLKQVDIDGKTYMSNVVEVVFGVQAGIQNVYPNPTLASKGFNVDYYAEERALVRVELLDMWGRNAGSLSANLETGRNTIEFPTQNLRAGIYFVRVINSGNSDVRKLIIAE
ncbi:MAG: T9SS type A sorting domain-containing protein [Bacteroidia bacterium]|nr:T9SS type A sorting domain-containing protein [Bacteroidia bacterium]